MKELPWALKDWSYEAMKAEQVREYINAVNPKMTTPTPRTDALTKRMAGELDRPMLQQNHFIELCDHSRQLERDLAAAQAQSIRDSMTIEHSRVDAYNLRLELAAAQEWKERVLDELIVAHIYTKEHDTNPKKAIHDAIVWNCQVAIDPAVSSDAQKLVAQERERCAKVCEEQEAVGNIDDLSYEIATVECAAAIRRGS